MSTEAVHSDGEALWGVSHAPEAVEVIMLSCRQPLRSNHLLVGRCGHSSQPRDVVMALRYPCNWIGFYGWPLVSQPAITRLQKQTDCLSFKSPWRYECGCSCFHFTPLEWTYAESKQPPYTSFKRRFKLPFRFRQWACNRPFNILLFFSHCLQRWSFCGAWLAVLPVVISACWCRVHSSRL